MMVASCRWPVAGLVAQAPTERPSAVTSATARKRGFRTDIAISSRRFNSLDCSFGLPRPQTRSVRDASPQFQGRYIGQANREYEAAFRQEPQDRARRFRPVQE